MRAKLRVMQESKQLIITARGDLYYRISSNKGKGQIQALMAQVVPVLEFSRVLLQYSDVCVHRIKLTYFSGQNHK